MKFSRTSEELLYRARTLEDMAIGLMEDAKGMRELSARLYEEEEARALSVVPDRCFHRVGEVSDDD